jgi:hypothetical protein
MPLGLGLMMGLGHNVAASGGGGGSTATWDTSGSGGGYSYSGGNLVATRSSGTGDSVVKTSTSKTSGSAKVTIGVSLGGSYVQVGLCNASQPTNGFMGADGNAIAYQNNGNILYNGGAVTSGAGYGLTDQVEVVWNGTTVQFKLNGTNQGSAIDVHTTIVSGFVAADTGAIGPALTLDVTGW